MGRRPDERKLRQAGAELLKKLRGTRPFVRMSARQRDALLEDLGTSPENVDDLMAVDLDWTTWEPYPEEDC